MPCHLCDGTCATAPLDGLVTADLAWLWAQLAEVADRRGDPTLADGATTVRAPADVAARAGAAGLLGRRHLAAGKGTRVDLADLAARIAPLAPGVVAAHATGRRLAVRAERRTARTANEAEFRDRLATLLPDAAREPAWAALRRAGWVTRILGADDRALVDKATTVIGLLPAPGDPSVDRRRLAHDATGDPHDLDRNRPVGGLALALLVATGRVATGTKPREAWESVGVAYDDITGGLTTLGIAPADWFVPSGNPVTVPPRVLSGCIWPAGDGQPVYVTENPSVLSAAVDIAEARVVCTSGTPSRNEVAAIARLEVAGWQLHVRADFDDAGINHMIAILAAAPSARPWRMTAGDYLYGLDIGESVAPLRVDRLSPTAWDSELASTMAAKRVAVYEEALLDLLLDDIRAEDAGMHHR